MQNGGMSAVMAGRMVLLLFGVFCMSTSVIFLKLSSIPAASVSGYRLLGTALLMTPIFWRRARNHRAEFPVRELRRCIVPGVLLAAHFITWVVGLRLTFAANATLAVNMVPVALPFFLFYLAGERVGRVEIVGTVVAVTGLVVMSVGDYRVGMGTLKGDLICTVSMLLLASYYAMGRRNMAFFPSVWLYLVPMNYLAGALCFAAALVLEGGVVWPQSGREWVWILGLVIFPTLMGHGLVNAALKHLRGQVVGLMTSSQFIFAGLLAYECFREVPQPSFFAASVLVTLGILIVLRSRDG